MEDVGLDELMRSVGASPSDEAGRRWLRAALDGIPHLVRAKDKKRPQATRNKELENVAKAAKALQLAYSKLDGASKAAVYWSIIDMPESAPTDRLRMLLRDELETDGIMAEILKELENAAAKAKRDTRPGVYSDEGSDEAVKLLAGFVERFGKRKVSPKANSPFHKFSQDAFYTATGERRNLLRSIERVVENRHSVPRRGA